MTAQPAISDPATEAAVLGSFLCHPEQSGAYIATNTRPDHFTGHHATVWKAMMSIHAEGGSVDFLSVANYLREQGKLDLIGGGAALNKLTDSAALPAVLPQCVTTLRELSARRRLHAVLASELPKATDPTEKVGDALARLLGAVEAIAAERTVKVHPTTKELVMQAVTRIEARMTGADGAAGFSTGIKRLDQSTGGLRRGSQWVLAGPAKGGKSSLALCLLSALAVRHKQRCAFFGLEMPSVENVERMLCLEGNASATHLRDGMLGERDFAAITSGAAKVAPAPIHWRDDVFDLVELTGTIRQLAAAHPDLFAVFVDYAQIVSTGSSGDDREREVAEISRTLRRLGLQLNLVIVMLSQVNDQGKLRESRTLGMDATKIVFIEFADDPGVRTLRLIQRDGPSESFDVAYVGDRFRFADLADSDL